jgi:cell division transport system permease protein
MEKLAGALSAIPEISTVEKILPEEAKENFASQMTGYEEMVRALPTSTFPASVEVHLTEKSALDMGARRRLAERIESVSMVERVDLYDTWYTKLIAVSTISRAAAAALGILSLVVSVLVVSATIRASVAARRREIEVLELVGATQRFIRFPFQLEGAIQTTAAMGIALLMLHFVTEYMQIALRDTMPLIGLDTPVRLGGAALSALLGGSTFAGIMGSRISLKKGHPVV